MQVVCGEAVVPEGEPGDRAVPIRSRDPPAGAAGSSMLTVSDDRRLEQLV